MPFWHHFGSCLASINTNCMGTCRLFREGKGHSDRGTFVWRAKMATWTLNKLI